MPSATLWTPYAIQLSCGRCRNGCPWSSASLRCAACHSSALPPANDTHPCTEQHQSQGILLVIMGCAYVHILQIFFKVVAATKDGRLVSVFDGTTKYELNKWTLAKHGAASWPPVYGCYYAFNTPEEAIAARFPEHR